MEVEFDDPKLQRVAEDSKKLVRQYGAIGAKRIQNRLAQLRAVGNVTDLKALTGNWHGLEADRSEQWAADLEHPKRIIIRPTPPAPRKPDGRIDWAEVRRVTVVEFVDYH
jgi:plasmid maintenance system killer protein